MSGAMLLLWEVVGRVLDVFEHEVEMKGKSRWNSSEY
jgi:hypothetical protein